METERHAAMEAYDSLQINESITIPDPPTKDGYEFMGWARISEDVSESQAGEGGAMPTGKVLADLTEEDLFLTYHKAEGESDGYYTAVINGNLETVTKVAADERNPYHDLYAVWKKKTYTVTVEKDVFGLEGDNDIPFTFTPSFESLPSEPAYANYNSDFVLVGNPEGTDLEEEGVPVHYDHVKVFREVPYGTILTITEDPHSEFDVYEAYDVTNADDENENKSVMRAQNGTEIEVNGDVVVKVINTRKSHPVRVLKTELDGETPLKGAVFTLSIEGRSYTLTSDEDGYLKNESFGDGIINVPFGTYTLSESSAPEGYIAIETGILFRVDASGIHTSYEVKEPSTEEEYYTIVVPNNPGVELPATGGSGVKWIYLLGICLFSISGIAFIIRKCGK